VGDDLRRRLDDLPEELEELYWPMMQRIKPAWYLEEGFRLLRMVKVSAGGVSLLRLFFAEIVQSRILALRTGQVCTGSGASCLRFHETGTRG